MIIDRKDLKRVWVSSHYDVPIEGICRIDGKLYHFILNDFGVFEDFDMPVKYRCIELRGWNKFRWLFRKKMFEWCIGYHCTYDENDKELGNFYIRNPKWLYDFLFGAYYDVQKLLRFFKHK